MENEKFFNHAIKEEFLSSYPEETQNTYAYVFRNTVGLEDFAEKDLYDFSLPQVEKVLNSLKFTRLSAAKTYGRVISAYFNWAIEKGLRKEENFLKNIGSNWFMKFVNEEKIFYTDKELLLIEDKLVNYQDKVIPRLLFEGVYGYMSAELINLTRNDIFNDELRLTEENGSIRKLKVSERTISFIERALLETEYQNKNGEAIGKRAVSQLVMNDYVLRTTFSKSTVNTEKSSIHLIYRRLSNIEDFFGLENFKAKDIWRSGMLCMGKSLHQRDGELTESHLQEIGERYNVSNPKSLKQFINNEVINNLYNN